MDVFCCHFSVTKPAEKPGTGSGGSLVPAPRQRAALTPTREPTARSSVPPPRPTAMPRAKSDYNVRAAEQDAAMVRNSSDTNLEKRADAVSSPAKSSDHSSATYTMPGEAAAKMSAANHFVEDQGRDLVRAEDSEEVVSLPPPTSLPPALPSGFSSRGPPPPLPASRPVGALPAGQSTNMAAGNPPGISAPVPAPRPDAAAGYPTSTPAANPTVTQVPVPAPRPDGVYPVGNSAGPPVPVQAQVAAPVPIPRRDNVANSAVPASEIPKAAAGGDTETPFIPPRPKAVAATQPAVTTAGTSGTPTIPARSAAAAPPPVPGRSNIPPPAIPPRQPHSS